MPQTSTIPQSSAVKFRTRRSGSQMTSGTKGAAESFKARCCEEPSNVCRRTTSWYPATPSPSSLAKGYGRQLSGPKIPCLTVSLSYLSSSPCICHDDPPGVHKGERRGGLAFSFPSKSSTLPPAVFTRLYSSFLNYGRDLDASLEIFRNLFCQAEASSHLHFPRL